MMLRSVLLLIVLAGSLGAQAQQKKEPPRVPPLPPGFGPRYNVGEPAKPAPQAQPPKEEPQQPAPEQAKPAEPQATPPVIQTPSGAVVLNLQNASLASVIDHLARSLKINYILDKGVQGSVTIHTYGDLKQVDPRALLETILRINGFAMVQVGDLYRIVPMADVSRLPLQPQVDSQTFPEDGRMMLNLVFLKYATAPELIPLLSPFIGEGARITAYDPANLLLILDNSRNLKRTMDLIAMFDNDVLAGQRVRLFEVEHGRPSDLAQELEQVMSAVSLTQKGTAVRFLPIDRINTLVAIAPNPGVFDQVETWLRKLDVEAQATAGTTDNYVYRVKYGRAETIAGAIMSLYLGYAFGFPFGGGGYGMSSGFNGYGMYGGGGGYGLGGFPMGSGMGAAGMYPGGGGYGGGMYPGGLGGGYQGGYGGGAFGGGYQGGYPGMGFAMMPQMGYPQVQPRPGSAPQVAQGQQQAGAAGAAGTRTPGQTTDLTGSYLGSSDSYVDYSKIPRIIPNPFDNTLLIQATPQDYQQILKLLHQIDVPPRQVLVEARIYEVNLQGAFSSGIQAYLRRRDAGLPSGIGGRQFVADAGGSGVLMTAGMLVGQSRQLLGLLSMFEDNRKAKLISAPSLIATDSMPASINVGTEVPTLTAQAVAGGIQSGGSSLFTQSIQTRQTGVTLNVLARVNPSGIVTMVINQEVSAPVAPPAGIPQLETIPSPSFSKRNVSTQITMQDGDTIAIGGIMSESSTLSSGGVPLLHRIPGIGAAFGNKSYSKERTELVIFMTPRIIYDTNQLIEASDEIRTRFKRLNKIIK